MSERTFPNAILNEETMSPSSGKEQVDELQTKTEDEEERNELLADDALDDSSSSYCTALCSLSEYSEALEDEEEILGNKVHYESASSESTDSIVPSGETAKSSSSEDQNKVRTKEDENSQDILGKVTFCGHDNVSSPVKDVFLESQHLSSFNETTISNSNTTNSADVQHEGAYPLNSSTKDSVLKPWDYSRNYKNTTQNETKPGENTGSLHHKFSLDKNEETLSTLGNTSSSTLELQHLQSFNKTTISSSKNINSADEKHESADPLNSSTKDSILKPWDYSRNYKNTTQNETKPGENTGSLHHKFSLDKNEATSSAISNEERLSKLGNYPSSTLESQNVQSFSKTKISNLNTVNVNSADEKHERADPLNLLKPEDYFRNYKNTAKNETKSGENTGSSQLRFPLDINEKPQSKLGKAASVSGTESHLMESKYSSGPENGIHNMNIVNMDTVDSYKAQPSGTSKIYSSLKSSAFRGNKNTAQTDSKPIEKRNCLELRLTSHSIWTSNQNNHERGQENMGNKPREDPTTPQQISKEDLNKHSTEYKTGRGGSNIGHMKWEREEQGKGVEEEQAELSLKAKNRTPTASCTSTLTASKQKSGFPPRCYSERILATRHQHHQRSPPLSQRLQKQSRQGVWLPSSLPPAPCSSYRRSCSSADNSKRKSGMASKLAETMTEVRGHSNPDVRSSCPEENYLEVFNSSSSQMFSGSSIQDWSGDVLEFKVASTDHYNTSACSEASSFECIDVALESHEERNRNTKTVPKRQIQLKRRDTVEGHAINHNMAEDHENNNDAIIKVPSTPNRPRDVLQRQHSTPAAFHQNSNGSEPKPIQTKRKQRLQKSLSLDETSGRTKMASCIIKNVLTKRMQHEQNLRDLDVSDNDAFVSIKADNAINNYFITSALDVSNKTTKGAPTTGPPFSCVSSSETPAPKTDPQTNSTSVKELITDSSKHKFNPQFSDLATTEFHGSGTEITMSPKTEKDKLSPSKELNSRSPGEKLSCDSAKGKAWNSSAAISRAIGKQDTVKPTLEECCAAQAVHKQHNVKKQATTSMEKQEKPGEGTNSTQSSTKAPCLAYDLDVDKSDNILSQSRPGKDQEGDRGELRPPGQSVNTSIQSQGKFKSTAPVHVVRDMRSLVKNTYSLSFRGPGEAAQGLEDTASGFLPATPYQVSSKGEDKGKGYKWDEKPHVRKVTPPLAVDRIRDLASLHATPKGCAAKTTSFLEPHDKTPNAGFTKVSPISTVKANTCAVLKSPGLQDGQTAIRQVDVQISNTNLKQTTRLGVPRKTCKESPSEIAKNGQSTDSNKPRSEKHRDSEWQYCPQTANSDQQGSCKEPKQVCPGTNDGNQTPGPPPRSQSSTGPSSTCILTVAPTPVLPSYFYQPNPLGYQMVSSHMGTVGYVQGPVLVKTQSHNQPATANGPATLMRSLSADGQLLSQPLSTAGNTSKETENREIKQKIPSPDTQQCATCVVNLGTEVIQGSSGMLFPEMGGGLGQSPCHMLLDPETGHYFYVEMPQLQQRKMLFDPQTCQYVEVLLPQQTLPSAVLPAHCAVPFPSLPLPTMYTPQCLSFVQAPPQVMPPPGP